MKGRRLSLALACLLGTWSGCSPGGGDGTLDPLADGKGAPEYFREAVEAVRKSDPAGAVETLRACLGKSGSYRLMPEILCLGGEAELALGDTAGAARCFRLLKAYYPRRWSALGEPSPPALALAHVPEPVGDRGAAEPNPGPDWSGAPADHVRKTVSNVFFETDIRQALSDVSAETGVPILADDQVRGDVTIEFDALPLEDCLKRLTQPFGLSFRWMDGYYLVGRADGPGPSSPLLARTIEIAPKHLRAADALRALPSAYAEHARASADGNRLTVTGSSDFLSCFRRDLASIDRPPEQVMIEALVVEMRRDVLREMGIDWEAVGTNENATFRIAKLLPAKLDSAFLGQLFKNDEEISGAVTDIKAAVRALEQRGRLRVRANPSVATLDGEKARIRVASESYYSLLSGSVTYSYYTLEKIATGITLEITPYAGETSEIITDIRVEVSDVRGAGANDLPVTSVREVETQIRIDNGETVMIGGLLAETERRDEDRIPFLGRIPGLGALFGHTRIEKDESEVTVFLTPYILIHPAELAGLLE